MVIITILIILKTRRMKVRRMQRGGIPHVYRVGRLLNMWMRRLSSNQSVERPASIFPPQQQKLLPGLIVSQEKLATGQYCKLGRQEGFGLGLSKRSRYSSSRGGGGEEEGGQGSMFIFCSLKLHPCGSLIAVMLIFIIIMQIRCPARKTDYCSREVQFVLLCTQGRITCAAKISRASRP